MPAIWKLEGPVWVGADGHECRNAAPKSLRCYSLPTFDQRGDAWREESCDGTDPTSSQYCMAAEIMVAAEGNAGFLVILPRLAGSATFDLAKDCRRPRAKLFSRQRSHYRSRYRRLAEST
jgi:hypothetical protein